MAHKSYLALIGLLILIACSNPSSSGTSTIISATNSTLSASKASEIADGATTVMISVSVKDSSSAGLQGKSVSLSSSRDEDEIVEVDSSTSVSGLIRFAVTSTAPGASTYTAVSDGVTISQTVDVTYWGISFFSHLKASNSLAGHEFGGPIAIDGDTMVVGVNSEDSNQTTITNGTGSSSNTALNNSGAVYVYRKNSDGEWAQEAYIKAHNAGNGDYFGYSVDIDGDTLVVGARYEDSDDTSVTNGAPGTAGNDDNANSSGAVYVYKRTGTTWAHEAFIKASNSEAADAFGNSVSVSGDLIAVGAFVEDSNATTITNGAGASADNSSAESGAVYIFTRTGSNWAQTAYLKAANADAGDFFGEWVNLDGNTLVVTAPNEDSNQTSITNGATASNDDSSADSGAVYVYERSGGNWSQAAYIKASNSTAGNHFGKFISLDSDRLAISSTLDDSNQTSITNGTTSSNNSDADDSGAVFVYKRTAGTWTQEAYIKASNQMASDQFGYSVSLKGNYLIAASKYEDGDGSGITYGSPGSRTTGDSTSSAFLFKLSDEGNWSQFAYIKSPHPDEDDFFFSPAMGEDFFVIGALGEDSDGQSITLADSHPTNNLALGSGAIYHYIIDEE